MGLARDRAIINSYEPPNLLKGLTPSVIGFDAGTPMVNLENMTDGNPDTYAGPAELIASGFAQMYIRYDLGSVKTVKVGGKVGLWSSANNMYAVIVGGQSTSNWNFYSAQQNQPITQTSEGRVTDLSTVTVTGRYLLFNFQIGGAGTAHVKPYKLWAIEEKGA